MVGAPPVRSSLPGLCPYGATFLLGCYDVWAHYPCHELMKQYRVRYRTCHIWIAFNIEYRIVVQYWLEYTRAAKFSTDRPHKLDSWNNIVNLLPAQIEKVA